MEDMRDSTVLPQIVKIGRMVVKFHPLLIITSLTFQVIFLQHYIEGELCNQWNVLKVYCQSRMRAMLELITEKMKNLSKALQMHLDNEVERGQPKAKVIGQVALFFATFLLLDTEFSSKYDNRGAKTQLLLLIGIDLLIRSKLWSQLGILRGRCVCVANSTSNFTFFILAIFFAKFYDNSLRTISVLLFIAVFFLCLLVVLRPRIDLGLFSFIIGVIGSITYNCFEFKFTTWIIASICFVLFSFKSWLDKYWLNLREDKLLTFTNTTTGSTNMFLILSLATVHIAGVIFASFVVKSPLSNYKVWFVRVIAGMIWNARLYKFYPKDTSLPFTNTKGISGLILTIVNVARGMFVFSLMTFPVWDYKDWLFAAISYVVFCFWLRNFCPEDLLPPSTNAKGISGVILFLKSIATYSIVVLAGLEPHLYYKEWLVVVTCYVLWWVRLRTSFPKYLLPSITVEFKALQWWSVVVNYMILEVTSWMIQLSKPRH
ncbi:hypothetical protein SLEP1_g28171 [Rubroshorea leprosula]|uniref:Uncharacterized protein n=1 Tax=Rubroshorea leprosula TaxID=152421 RepID=A0AAV5K1H5_9ROSI|nr:hypothetical protein SLEP1_g28171 [Rubroshorea leprosula]